jgi:hypothetical protein
MPTVGIDCVACRAASQSVAPAMIASTPRANKLGKNSPSALRTTFCRPPLDDDRAVLDPTQIAQPVYKGPCGKENRIRPSDLSLGHVP